MSDADSGAGINSPRSADRYAALMATVQDLLGEVDGLRSGLHALVREPDPADESDPGGDIPRLREAVVHLAADVSSLLRDTESLPSLPCWVDLDAEAAGKAWQLLHDWVRDVLLVRYPRITERELLPPCWYRHPEAVEQLSWLHITWCHAYRNPDLPPTAAAEWHVRWLEHVLSWLKSNMSCANGHEEDGVDTAPQAVDDGFAAFVRADVADRPLREEVLDSE